MRNLAQNPKNYPPVSLIWGARAGTQAGPRRRGKSGEEGYLLIAVLFLTFMVLITLSIAAPKVAADLQRDREVELMHRGKQFQRAIQLYYRKFHAYPPTMEALEKSNEIRFLRRRYKDPMTGKDEWHLIHYGEAKTQTLGFFGQPIAGAGSAGGSLLAGVGPGATPGLGSPIGSPGLGSAIGGAATDPNASNATTQTAQSSTDPNAANGATSTDPNAANSANGTNGASGPGGGNSLNGGSGTSSFSSSLSGGNQQTFGGGGIIGVESSSPKLAILEYKKKKHYNEWEFIYDPLSETMTLGSNMGAVGAPIGGQNSSSPFGGSQFGNSANGIQNGGSQYGGSQNGGNQPTPPPPTPQQ